MVGRKMSRVPQTGQGDSSVGTDRDPGDGGVLQADSEPRLGGKLERPAGKVADHVGVAHHQFHAVFLLVGRGAVEIFSVGETESEKSSGGSKWGRTWKNLDSLLVLLQLLLLPEGGFDPGAVHVVISVRSPPRHVRFRPNGGALSQEVVRGGSGEVRRQLPANQGGRLQGSSHASIQQQQK